MAGQWFIVGVSLLVAGCAAAGPVGLIEGAEQRARVAHAFGAERGGRLVPPSVESERIFNEVRQAARLSQHDILLVALEGAQFRNAALLDDKVVIIGTEFEAELNSNELRFVFAHELAHLLHPIANEEQTDESALVLGGFLEAIQ